MQAAIIAKKRGHDVTIVEKGDTLGGQMFIAGVPPFKLKKKPLTFPSFSFVSQQSIVS